MQTQLPRHFAALFALAACGGAFAQIANPTVVNGAPSTTAANSGCVSAPAPAPVALRESPTRASVSSWDLATNKGARTVPAPSPAAASACDHAINTKGTGAQGGLAVASSTQDASAKRADALEVSGQPGGTLAAARNKTGHVTLMK